MADDEIPKAETGADTKGGRTDGQRGTDVKREIKKGNTSKIRPEDEYVRVSRKHWELLQKQVQIQEGMIQNAQTELRMMRDKLNGFERRMQDLGKALEDVYSDNEVRRAAGRVWLESMSKEADGVLEAVREHGKQLDAKLREMSKANRGARRSLGMFQKEPAEEKEEGQQTIEFTGRQEKAANEGMEAMQSPNFPSGGAAGEDKHEKAVPEALHAPHALPQYAREKRKRAEPPWRRAVAWARNAAAVAIVGVVGAVALNLGGVRDAAVQAFRPAAAAIGAVAQDADGAYELKMQELGASLQKAEAQVGYKVEVPGIREAQKEPVLSQEIRWAYGQDVRDLKAAHEHAKESGRVQELASFEGRIEKIAEFAGAHIGEHGRLDSEFAQGKATKGEYWQKHGELAQKFRQNATRKAAR